MDDFQKITVQMMEQRVQQQKELQRQRNEERLLQALMKSEERRNHMEELSMYQKRIKPLMHSTEDMKTYLTWTAKNGQTKKKGTFITQEIGYN